jgi:hypothetical protein
LSPAKDIEPRLKKAVISSAGIPGIEEQTIFAYFIATEVANVVKGRGYLSHRIERGKGIDKEVWVGYEEDPIKASSSYVAGIAAGVAKKDMAFKMVRAVSGTDIDRADFDSYEDYLAEVKKRRIDPDKQKNLYHDVQTYMEEQLRNEEVADRIIGFIKGVTVLKYLGLRVGSALVNLTALATSAPAAMNEFAGVPLHKTLPALGKAIGDYARYKRNPESLDPFTRKVFDYIYEKGWHKAQYNHINHTDDNKCSITHANEH